MKKIAMLLAALLCVSCLAGVAAAESAEPEPCYTITFRSEQGIETENASAAATFIVYPDGAVTEEEAKALLDEIGMTEILQRCASTAYVAIPVNGESFTQEDMPNFVAIASRAFSPQNLKVVGFGNGATFVNQNAVRYANAFSGLMSVGGEAGIALTASVPAYISGNLDAAAAYIAADNAQEVAVDGTVTTYVNPESRFELVVTNSAQEDAAAAFHNAWESVLCKFGRLGNYTEEVGAVGTFYMCPMITGDEAKDTSRKYQYFDSVDAIDNITRYVLTEDLDGDGIDSLWYEYVPDASVDAPAGTVPVVFLMHGNTNDPRTQYETSGWANIASAEGLILVCPEWQGHTFQGYDYDPMTEDSNATPDSDFIKVVNKVLDKYPQADRSRVYVSGLSAGSMNTINNGVANPKYFAAGAGQSGPFGFIVNDQVHADVAMNKEQYDFPIIFFTGDKDEYLMGDFDKLEVNGGLQILQIYQELNDMEVTQVEDLSEENIDLYGIPWTERYTIEATPDAICKIVGGVVRNEKGVEICMNRLYNWGHWNYAPDAQLMWNFMKKYSRDVETGEIIIAQ